MKKLALCSLALVLAMGIASLSYAATLQDKIDKDNSTPPGGPRGLLDCTGAIEAGCDFFYQGDTSFGVNNAQNYSCHGYTESGPEIVFSLSLAVDSQVTITMTPSGCDLDLHLLAGCDEDLCIEYSAGVSTEVISVDCLAAGDYYIVVDGYGGAACPFTIDVSCSDCAEPSGGETCEECTDLACGDVQVQTDTSGAIDNYNPGAGNYCTGYSASGGDIAYCVCVPDQGGVHLQFSEDTYDASIYLVADCNDLLFFCVGDDCFPNPCIDYIDWDNTTGSDADLFLIVDGFGGSTGQGTLTGTLDCCGAVPTIETSWGALKSLYR